MKVSEPCILVGVDFSEGSRRAVDHAAALSAKLDAELLLLHAWNPTGWVAEPDVSEAGEAWLDSAQESLRARLQEWGQSARRAGLRVSTRMEAGAASRSIAEVARERRASLVAVGRRGHARLSHVLLGSVSERVVHLAPCPVLVVPGENAAAGKLPERLLVGVDFSSGSRDALDAAVRFARGLEVPRGLVLVHAYPGERELWLANWSELACRARWPHDQQELESWAEPRLGTGMKMKARVVDGRTETVLLELARSEQCGWIVLGVRGRTPLAALRIGSTTDRVLKLADRPVLTVPPTSTAV